MPDKGRGNTGLYDCICYHWYLVETKRFHSFWLLSACHVPGALTDSLMLNPSGLLRQLFLSPFYSWWKWSLHPCMPRATQLLSGRAGIKIFPLSVWLPNLALPCTVVFAGLVGEAFIWGLFWGTVNTPFLTLQIICSKCFKYMGMELSWGDKAIHLHHSLVFTLFFSLTLTVCAMYSPFRSPLNNGQGKCRLRI